MTRQTSLDKRAKEVILNQMEQLGEITTEEVMSLIRPHFMFDVAIAKEQSLRRKANNIMRQFKDSKGQRTCYNYKDSTGTSVYANIDITKDLEALNKIEEQLNKKFYGLNASKRKISRRRMEILGQMSLEEVI